ncbi:MAG: aminopeptidase P family protein [Mangrovibacterium sp.]
MSGKIIQGRIDQLRKQMKNHGLDAFYISGTDPHQSEDLPPHWQVREFISGFTGSLGMIVITEHAAALWTDSRYFLQAATELEGTAIRLMKLRTEGFPTPEEWLGQMLPPGSVTGTDACCMSFNQFRNFKKSLKGKGIELKDSGDLTTAIWPSRKPLPRDLVFEHEIHYSGLTRLEKIDLIRQKVKASGAVATIISALDDLAWTFNLRGHDIFCNPVFIAYSLITDNTISLYIDSLKIPLKIGMKLNKEGISVKPYDGIFEELRHLKGKILIDPDRTNQALVESLSPDAEIIELTSVPAMLKAIKSQTELDQIRQTMKKDGVAMIDFLFWLHETIGKREISDYNIAVQLEYFRSLQDGYQGISFPAIIGYKQTGAIVHRRVTKENAVPVFREGILLVDSGGHYLSGTTDITRTITLAEPTSQEREDFTIALKGMINLTMACFPAGIKGCNLDILARKAMWDRGITYGHGTSHGVGYFLNVHEGPMNIRQEYNEHPIRPGMVLSNEPGIYREGLYGVRTENMMVCVDRGQTEFGQFYGFETLTLCPIDLKLIEKDLMSAQEIGWVDNYHKWCFNQLSPFLNEEKKSFLKSLTRQLI